MRPINSDPPSINEVGETHSYEYFLIRIFDARRRVPKRGLEHERGAVRGPPAAHARDVRGVGVFWNARLRRETLLEIEKTPSGFSARRRLPTYRLPPFFLLSVFLLSAFAFAEERSRRRSHFCVHRPRGDGRKNGGGGASVDRGAHGVFQSRRRVLATAPRRLRRSIAARALSKYGASAAVFSPGVVSSNTSSVSARVTRLNETVSVVRSTETPVTHERLVTERHGALAAPSPATIAAQTLEDDDADARSAAASPFGVASSPGLATPPSAFAASASSSATAVSSGSAAGSGGHVFSGSQDVFSSRRRVVARAEAFSFSFVARDFAADALDFGFFDLPGTRARARAAARGAS